MYKNDGEEEEEKLPLDCRMQNKQEKINRFDNKARILFLFDFEAIFVLILASFNVLILD